MIQAILAEQNKIWVVSNYNRVLEYKMVRPPNSIYGQLRTQYEDSEVDEKGLYCLVGLNG